MTHHQESQHSPPRYVVVNADDFGISHGVNRGIVDAHARGVVTSTSLMVARPAARDAAAMSRDYPDLGIGLHFDHLGDDVGPRGFDTDDSAIVRDALRRQLEQFHALLGRGPTHLDSHHHLHRQPHLIELFRATAAELNAPLRSGGQINYVGGFYAQWEWRVTELRYVSAEFLEELLRDQALPGEWTELSCHPGYVSPDFQSVYLTEREAELKTLVDPRVRQIVAQLGVRLCTFADFSRASAGGRVA